MLNFSAPFFFGLIAFAIALCLCAVLTKKFPKALILSIMIGVGTFFTVHYFAQKNNQKREREFQSGETITTLIQRVEHSRNYVFILTEDKQTFSEFCDVKYKMLLPGDTLIYQRSTKGETRIVDVRYTTDEPIQGYLKKMEEHATGQ